MLRPAASCAPLCTTAGEGCPVGWKGSCGGFFCAAGILGAFLQVCMYVNMCCPGELGMQSVGQCQTAMLVCIMRHKAVRRERKLCMGMGRQVSRLAGGGVHGRQLALTAHATAACC